ncbi:MAG: T9SS type A sorting domain-containing protein, partial [bacterium]
RVIMEGSEVEQGIRRAPNRKENLAPEAPQIGEAFPNPFNITTTIPLELRSASLIEVAVYDALGGEVERVSYGVLAEGRHHLNLSGHSWASGTYFVRVIAERKSVALRRVILVK